MLTSDFVLSGKSFILGCTFVLHVTFLLEAVWWESMQRVGQECRGLSKVRSSVKFAVAMFRTKVQKYRAVIGAYTPEGIWLPVDSLREPPAALSATQRVCG